MALVTLHIYHTSGRVSPERDTCHMGTITAQSLHYVCKMCVLLVMKGPFTLSDCECNIANNWILSVSV